MPVLSDSKMESGAVLISPPKTRSTDYQNVQYGGSKFFEKYLIPLRMGRSPKIGCEINFLFNAITEN